MKTLYISDLDGTLLKKNEEISRFSRDVINRFTSGGHHFTIATARTSDTVLHILEGVELNVPAVLLNGVSVYDTRAHRYQKVEAIGRPCLGGLFETLADFGITGFVYSFEAGDIAHYYENLDSEHRKAFHDIRSGKYGRVYTKVGAFAELCDRDIVYFSTADDHSILAPVCEELKTHPGLNVEFYRDVYHENFWYMEVCSAAASKYNAVMYLKAAYGFERVVSFGDNLNDLSMFRASDECYAVENAKAEVKKRATAVIGENEGDGVAKWLEKILSPE